jgi:hypothetical protein
MGNLPGFAEAISSIFRSVVFRILKKKAMLFFKSSYYSISLRCVPEHILAWFLDTYFCSFSETSPIVDGGFAQSMKRGKVTGGRG